MSVGLASPDGGLRGTALEPLESILPAAPRRVLWPRLGAAVRAASRQGAHGFSTGQMPDESWQSAVGEVVDLEALGRSA